MKKNILIVLAVVIVAGLAALVQYGPQFGKEKASREGVLPAGGEAVVEQPYTNEKGEKWGPLMQNAYLFQVASAESAEPKFLEGKIDPLDVHVGDVQKFRIVVQSPAGIKSVIAEIETDNGTTTVPLKKMGIVTYREMMPEKYVVENNALKVLTPVEVQMNHLKKVIAERGLFGRTAQ